jgi:hypothetical protein
MAAVRIEFARRQRRDPGAPEMREAISRMAVTAVFAVIAATVLASLVMSCGGLDSAGYVGAADLLRRGHLTDAVPIARVLPFDHPEAAAAPLGWVPAREPWHIAPRFPLGLPIVMVVARLAGSSGPFFVAPVLGAGAAVFAYLIARRSTDVATASLAAVFVAAGPTFVDQAIQPMSDVPATFWLLLCAWAAWDTRPRPALFAIAGGMATLTRPPLLLAVIAVAATARWPLNRRTLGGAAILFAFAAAFAAVQWRLYGHPLTSGYGSAGSLFAIGAIPGNVAVHLKWLTINYTPLAFVAFAAGAWRDRRFAVRATATFFAVALPYALYSSRFDDWEVTRFLLPGWVFVLLVCASGVTGLAGPARGPRWLVSATAAVLVLAASMAYLAARGTYDVWLMELKYPLAASWIAANTPPDAVVISELHSGSLRHYTGRTILRQASIPSGAVAATVRAVERSGRSTYVALETGTELTTFLEESAPLDVQPLATVRGVTMMRVGPRR